MIKSLMTILVVLIFSQFLLLFTTLATPSSNPLIENSEQINADFARGFTTLVNCNYFIKNYPKYRKKLLTHTKVWFGYTTDPAHDPYIAVTRADENTILLTDKYFAITDANTREGTMGHELMHIIGMPQHRKSPMYEAEDRRKDPIYTVEHFCYHKETPWLGYR
jgi:hypothetical protein